MIFRSEADVRRWVLKAADKVLWIEGKRGSSPGLPDALVFRGARMVACELKVAAPRVGLGWTVEASPAQISTLREMRTRGLSSWVVAGIVGTDRMGAVRGTGLVRIAARKGIGKRGTYLIGAWDHEWSAEEDGLGLLLQV